VLAALVAGDQVGDAPLALGLRRGEVDTADG
jgi:hypothetical protein